MDKNREHDFAESVEGVSFEYYRAETTDSDTGEALEYWYWKRLDIPDGFPGQYSFLPGDTLADARIDARHEVRGLNYVTEAEVQEAIARMRAH